MRIYCTYFDRGYLPQGLVLAASLARHDPSARLEVLALDELTARVCRRLLPSGCRVTELESWLEADVELAAVVAGRCGPARFFTLTPAWIRHVVATAGPGAEIAYVDADVALRYDPATVWAELARGEVWLSEHRYPCWHDDSRAYGRFNVGWLAFRDGDVARALLGDWRRRCLESVGLLGDGVVYGDQKYLDAWPTAGGAAVVVSGCPGANLGPWNWAAHGVSADSSGAVRVDGEPLLAYHFAQLKWLGGPWWDSGQVEYSVMPYRIRSAIYGPYMRELRAAALRATAADPEFRWRPVAWRAALRPAHVGVLRVLAGQFWREGAGGVRSYGAGMGRWTGPGLGWYRRHRA